MASNKHSTAAMQLTEHNPYLTRPPFRMPPEIIIMILHHLRRNKTALTRCALVSREWAPLAYEHAFRRVTICQPTDGLWSGIGRFLECLRGSPYLAPYVRELVLEGDYRSRDCDRQICMEHLHALLVILDELQVLRITRAHIQSAHPYSGIIPITFKRLRRLHLTSLSSSEGSFTLGQILQSFSQVDELHLDSSCDDPSRIAFLQPGSAVIHPCFALADKPRVGATTLTNFSASSTASVLWTLRCCSHAMKAVSLQVLDLSTIWSLEAVLQTGETTLHSLELDLHRLPFAFTPRQLQTELLPESLSLPSLETLRLSMMTWAQDCYSTRNAALWRCLCKLLLAVRNSVRRVHVTLHTAEVRIPIIMPATKDPALRALEALDWLAFDDAILQCSSLDTVEIEVVNGGAEDGTYRWLCDEVRDIARSRISHKSISVSCVR